MGSDHCITTSCRHRNRILIKHDPMLNTETQSLCIATRNNFVTVLVWIISCFPYIVSRQCWKICDNAMIIEMLHYHNLTTPKHLNCGWPFVSEMLKPSKIITPKQVLRCASICGAFDHNLVFTQSSLSGLLPQDRKYENDGYNSDIKRWSATLRGTYFVPLLKVGNTTLFQIFKFRRSLRSREWNWDTTRRICSSNWTNIANSFADWLSSGTSYVPCNVIPA